MGVTKRKVGSTDSGSTTKNSNITSKNSKISIIQKHLMTGISYMIPVLIMGGLIGAFSQIIPYIFLKVDPSLSIMDALNSGAYKGSALQALRLSSLLSTFGFTLFGFAIPMFAAFTANSIGGKTALICGFIGGYIANNPVGIPSLVDGEWTTVAPTPSGFLGGLIIAFAIGYFVKFLNEKIKVSHNMMALKTTFLVPLLSALATFILMIFVVTPFGSLVNTAITNVLTTAGKSGEIVYTVLLSGATAVDLGGPINKAAGFVATALTVDKIMPVTSRVIAIVTPSIGLGLSAILDKVIVKRRVYEKQFYEAGKTSIFLAFMGISEGAIPFALEKPGFIIPLNIVGSIIGSVFAVKFGAVQYFPESAIWAWPLIDGIVPYVLGIAVGSLFIAVINILYRNHLINKGELTV